MKDKVAFIFDLAVKGHFGTPESPNRGSSGKAAFWNAFNGRSGAYDPARGSFGYEYVQAGKAYRAYYDLNRSLFDRIKEFL